MAVPANASAPHLSSIAGSVLPIKRAEELLCSLPGVVSAKIVAADSGAVDEIHLLTTAEVTPKQTVRNVESALLAHLGMRVDHRKISVATTVEPRKPHEPLAVHAAPRNGTPLPNASSAAPMATAASAGRLSYTAPSPGKATAADAGRRFYFEHVDLRRSRTRGVACRVTLRKGDASFVGESEGPENDRSRAELAARATIQAIGQAEDGGRGLLYEGCKLIEAFDREFVFVGLTVRLGRESVLLTGSCEVRESPETASALAVLDATNRWLGLAR